MILKANNLEKIGNYTKTGGLTLDSATYLNRSIVYAFFFDDDMYYIGSTDNIKSRVLTHVSQLNNKKGARRLQIAYDNYDTFDIYLLEDVDFIRENEKYDSIDRIDRESFYICKFLPVLNTSVPNKGNDPLSEQALRIDKKNRDNYISYLYAGIGFGFSMINGEIVPFKNVVRDGTVAVEFNLTSEDYDFALHLFNLSCHERSVIEKLKEGSIFKCQEKHKDDSSVIYFNSVLFPSDATIPSAQSNKNENTKDDSTEHSPITCPYCSKRFILLD